MTQKQNIKAKLEIVLKADETVVANSFDPVLWQNVLAAINTPSEDSTDGDLGLSSPVKGPIQELAKEIGVSVEILQGACSPSNSVPFIHLDKHHWEAMKKDTPSRGPNAISATALAATLLILWKEKAGLGNATMADSNQVLQTISVIDKNPSRSLNNCEWLQLRSSTVIINPAQTSKAVYLAKAYCTKEWKKK